MSKKSDIESSTQISVNEALSIITSAQKRTTSEPYKNLFSEPSKVEFFDTIIKMAKRLVIFFSYVIMAIVILWIASIVCIACKLLDDCSGLIWFNNLVQDLAKIFIFTIVPSVASFLAGNFLGKRK